MKKHIEIPWKCKFIWYLGTFCGRFQDDSNLWFLDRLSEGRHGAIKTINLLLVACCIKTRGQISVVIQEVSLWNNIFLCQNTKKFNMRRMARLFTRTAILLEIVATSPQMCFIVFYKENYFYNINMPSQSKI